MYQSDKTGLPIYVAELKRAEESLGRKVFGNVEFKKALVAAYYKRLRGLPSHLMTYGPTGIGKTWATKNFAKILSEQLDRPDQAITYARIQGRPDLMPEEILADRIVKYNNEGKPEFGYQLGTIKVLQADDNKLPAILQADELDKMTPRAMYALLEIMEEQQVSLPDGRTVKLNFVMIATANTRRYDATANPIPRPVQDRFRAGVVHLGYCTPAEDRKILDWHVNSWNFGATTDDVLQGIVTVVKITQQKMTGYSDFTKYIKVPAGPRAILDLYSEAATQAIFDGRTLTTPQDVITVGVRILRGRVEVTPDAEVNGKTADIIITEILYEVFGDMQIDEGSSGDQSQDGELSDSTDDDSQAGDDTSEGNESDEGNTDSDETTNEADRQGFLAQVRKEGGGDEAAGEQPDPH